MISLIAACGFSLLAAVTFYLASPNQQIQSKPWPRKISYSVTSLAIVVAFMILLQLMASVAATFLLVTLLMVYWSFLPLIVTIFLRRPHHRHSKK